MWAPELTLQVEGSAELSWLVSRTPPRPGGVPRDDMDCAWAGDRLSLGWQEAHMGGDCVQSGLSEHVERAADQRLRQLGAKWELGLT